MLSTAVGVSTGVPYGAIPADSVPRVSLTNAFLGWINVTWVRGPHLTTAAKEAARVARAAPGVCKDVSAEHIRGAHCEPRTIVEQFTLVPRPKAVASKYTPGRRDGLQLNIAANCRVDRDRNRKITIGLACYRAMRKPPSAIRVTRAAAIVHSQVCPL